MNKNSNNFDVILLGTIFDMEIVLVWDNSYTYVWLTTAKTKDKKNIHPADYELRGIIVSQPSVYYGTINLFVANLQEIKGIKHL